MARSDRKRKLFDVGREALSKVLAREVPGYVCPICLQVFPGLEDLSEEHVPPKSIGGKVLCLTCRACNSSAGYGVDAHVVREKISRSFLASDGRARRAKIAAQRVEVNIDLRRDETGSHIKVLGGQNDPNTVAALKSVMRDVVQEHSSFQIRDTVCYSRRKADLGYLKSGYLAVFAKLGYTYIRRPALNRVRQQIRNPNRGVLERVRVYTRQSDGRENTFLLFDEPISCLGVKIGNSTVCLPSLEGDDRFYEELANVGASGSSATWRGSGSIRWPERLEFALDFAEE